jgi:hypothetical protein
METLERERERIKVMVKAIDDLEEIVDEYGHDYIYETVSRREDNSFTSCWYVKDDQPDCLIAKFLFRRGWTIEELKSCERTNIGAASRRFPDRLTRDEIHILLAAQQAQDNGETWGAALNKARAEAFYLIKNLL